MPPFELLDVVVISERRRGNSMFAEATVKLRIGDEIVHTVAEGDGPVHALDGAFHKALNPHFPLVATCTWSTTRSASWTPRRPPAPRRACSSRRRATARAGRWSTIGVSQNIIEASATALADAMELPLVRARA